MKQIRPLGHPAHPPTTHLPLGLWLIAPLWDGLALWSGNASWWTVSFWTLAAGTAAGALAAATGFVDYLNIDDQRPEAKAALWHMGLMGTALCVEILNLLLRQSGASLSGPRAIAAAGLSVLAAILLSVGGWWGGEMVYKHRVGVAPEQ